jgi:carbonyl reductase 1
MILTPSTVRNLALEYSKSSLNSGPLLIYLTACSSTRGEEALKGLLLDPQLKAAKALQKDGGLTTIVFSSLDITDENSIRDFKDLIQKEHPDGIDILVNNAGIYIDAKGKIFMLPSQNNFRKKDKDIHGRDRCQYGQHLTRNNYYGTLAMMKGFLPLIRPKGRVVNVATEDGRLELYSESLKQAFIGASRTSPETCTALMEQYSAAIGGEREEAEGWPIVGYAYAVSKASEIAVTKAVAMEVEKKGGKVLINACCPGFVNTDMTRGHGVLTVAEGAKTPVLLALGDIGDVTGGFWKEGVVVEWCPGKGI